MRCWLLLLTLLVPTHAWADVKGLPYSDRFQSAAYPYARLVSGCTEWRRPTKDMGDTWGAVSFAGACEQHDRCFHTIGATIAACNEAYLKDLKASCNRDLDRARLESGRVGKADAAAVSLCYQIAGHYAAQVESPDAAKRFAFDQAQEHEYLQWVRGVVSDVYRSVLRRAATPKEESRALATLEQDYSLGDLKAALMGARLDQEAREPLPDIELVGEPTATAIDP